jgi:hypothetical protein
MNFIRPQISIQRNPHNTTIPTSYFLTTRHAYLGRPSFCAIHILRLLLYPVFTPCKQDTGRKSLFHEHDATILSYGTKPFPQYTCALRNSHNTEHSLPPSLVGRSPWFIKLAPDQTLISQLPHIEQKSRNVFLILFLPTLRKSSC